MASADFEKLFTAHVLATAAKQRHLESAISDSAWGVDMGAGQLSFGADSYRIEVLGTQSDGDNSWLWGWANAASGLPEHVLTRTQTLPEMAGGSVPELVQRSFSQDVADGHQLSVVATGLLAADAYYRCPYDGGQLFVLLFDDKLKTPSGPSVADFASTALYAIQAYSISDHRGAVQAYATTIGLTESETDTGASYSGSDGSATAEFNDDGLLSSINASLRPGSAISTDEATQPAKPKRGFFRRKG